MGGRVVTRTNSTGAAAFGIISEHLISNLATHCCHSAPATKGDPTGTMLLGHPPPPLFLAAELELEAAAAAAGPAALLAAPPPPPPPPAPPPPPPPPPPLLLLVPVKKWSPQVVLMNERFSERTAAIRTCAFPLPADAIVVGAVGSAEQSCSGRSPGDAAKPFTSTRPDNT